MILTAYRHGFRSAELVDLQWQQIEFASAALHVRRVKRGTPSTHPILGDELRALRRLQREQEPKSPFVFTSERGAPFTTAGFARMVERAGVEASKRTRICSGTPAVTRSPTRGTIQGRCRLIWATATFSTQFDTPSLRLPDLRIFGGFRSAFGGKADIQMPSAFLCAILVRASGFQ
jgi:hypothetical protein